MVDKRIVGLIIIIAILAIGIGYGLYSHENSPKITVNNTTANNTTVKNATLEQSTASSSDSESGQYGYCAICGKALTYSEANSEYTQGKTCKNCAQNPYYQSGEGTQYANQKLYEAYPDEYAWMYEDTGDDYGDYDDGNYYYEYEDDEY